MSTVADVPYHDALNLLADGAILIDVRTDDEWEAGHDPRAQHLELAFLPDSYDALPRERTLVFVCRSGIRSRRAAEFVAEKGYSAVNADGGMVAWAEAGCELEGASDSPHIA
jgi:rhodanese-related sulfurtransferase